MTNLPEATKEEMRSIRTAKTNYRITSKMGRCADGAERDSGTIFHAVVNEYKAMCGTTYGRRSAGWSMHTGVEVTCEKCKRALLRQWIKETNSL